MCQEHSSRQLGLGALLNWFLWGMEFKNFKYSVQKMIVETDTLEERIMAFEGFVQSMTMAAFSKI